MLLLCTVMSAVPVPSKNCLEMLDDFRYNGELWWLHNWIYAGGNTVYVQSGLSLYDQLSKIFVGVYQISWLISMILRRYIYHINFYPLAISAITLIPILIIHFNISHVIQPLCMQSATSVDHTASAQLHR